MLVLDERVEVGVLPDSAALDVLDAVYGRYAKASKAPLKVCSRVASQCQQLAQSGLLESGSGLWLS